MQPCSPPTAFSAELCSLNCRSTSRPVTASLPAGSQSCPPGLQKEESNPIKQDIKKDKLRFYPYNILWNYGMLPQTWEDPEHANPELGGVKVGCLRVPSLTLGRPGLFPAGGSLAQHPLGLLEELVSSSWPCAGRQ